ncbi:hypothetical protein L6250_03120 [Candidatus Parcubacteria bacterium]|nr:hypothetical protein [Patescibacteria group bacterium]MBU4466965.1 hypothetical protein [Patescibacteria group bacterium]MCG2688598.1 hypothetical protein [Candidatus Parcubacteria bacterium]
MKKIKSFFRGAWDKLSCVFIVLACIVAFVILLIVASVEEAIVWIAKLLGKEVKFAPIFPDEEDWRYDY